jgi:linoleoyl-CoA desaturase
MNDDLTQRSSQRYLYKIHDKLYDLTEFVKNHPGGEDVFKNLKTYSNITPMIYAYHKNPKNLLTMLPKYEIPLKNETIIRYDTNYSYEQYCDLKKMVYDEIQEKKIPLYWSNKEIAYNAFMLSCYLGIWVYCFWNSRNLSYWWMVLLAFMNTGICNLIFHETAHYAGFKNQKINSYLTMCSYPVMVESNWKFKHNYLHHSFTNTEHDSDFSLPNQIIRHSNYQKYNWYNKFQSFYSLLIFQLSFLYKGFFTSIKQKGSRNWLCFPLLLCVFGFYKTIFWYSLCGLLFAFIAQISHIQHECIQLNTENKNDFLYNQVSSSMNYKTDNLVMRILCFSLDIQIEHHLFPNIPHSSLRKIQRVVREYCEKNNIPYIEKPSIFPAIYSYICYLYSMGIQ